MMTKYHITSKYPIQKHYYYANTGTLQLYLDQPAAAVNDPYGFPYDIRINNVPVPTRYLTILKRAPPVLVVRVECRTGLDQYQFSI